eukprot:scaffold7755_cov248-Pinguiococcus_pyrenoidosus.AAC.2
MLRRSHPSLRRSHRSLPGSRSNRPCRRRRRRGGRRSSSSAGSRFHGLPLLLLRTPAAAPAGRVFEENGVDDFFAFRVVDKLEAAATFDEIARYGCVLVDFHAHGLTEIAVDQDLQLGRIGGAIGRRALLHEHEVLRPVGQAHVNPTWAVDDIGQEDLHGPDGGGVVDLVGEGDFHFLHGDEAQVGRLDVELRDAFAANGVQVDGERIPYHHGLRHKGFKGGFNLDVERLLNLDLLDAPGQKRQALRTQLEVGCVRPVPVLGGAELVKIFRDGVEVERSVRAGRAGKALAGAAAGDHDANAAQRRGSVCEVRRLVLGQHSQVARPGRHGREAEWKGDRDGAGGQGEGALKFLAETQVSGAQLQGEVGRFSGAQVGDGGGRGGADATAGASGEEQLELTAAGVTDVGDGDVAVDRQVVQRHLQRDARRPGPQQGLARAHGQGMAPWPRALTSESTDSVALSPGLRLEEFSTNADSNSGTATLTSKLVKVWLPRAVSSTTSASVMASPSKPESGKVLGDRSRPSTVKPPWTVSFLSVWASAPYAKVPASREKGWKATLKLPASLDVPRKGTADNVAGLCRETNDRRRPRRLGKAGGGRREERGRHEDLEARLHRCQDVGGDDRDDIGEGGCLGLGPRDDAAGGVDPELIRSAAELPCDGRAAAHEARLTDALAKRTSAAYARGAGTGAEEGEAGGSEALLSIRQHRRFHCVASISRRRGWRDAGDDVEACQVGVDSDASEAALEISRRRVEVLDREAHGGSTHVGTFQGRQAHDVEQRLAELAKRARRTRRRRQRRRQAGRRRGRARSRFVQREVEVAGAKHVEGASHQDGVRRGIEFQRRLAQAATFAFQVGADAVAGGIIIREADHEGGVVIGVALVKTVHDRPRRAAALALAHCYVHKARVWGEQQSAEDVDGDEEDAHAHAAVVQPNWLCGRSQLKRQGSQQQE